MAVPVRTRKVVIFGGAALLIVLSVATLAFTASAQGPSCTHAQGRLFNTVPGRMIGTISGVYTIDSFDASYSADGGPVFFQIATSHVEGQNGTINFKEYSAIDFSEEQGLNGAVLLVVTGGTGKWENASGHIALSGFFHLSESTGEWDYQGDVCVP